MTALCPCCGSKVAAVPVTEIAARELPPVQAAVLRALSVDFGQYVKTRHLADRVWASDPSGGPSFSTVCVSQAIARLRPVVAKHGLTVDAVQYQGYRVRAA